ncbi:MAG TPA: YihY/virulence factor BrkB family protein [Thermomicrobiaceae bacterium]|nr:YihY/virulence factor BrkB family protein [Thermomicrobiaceae bacterium]
MGLATSIHEDRAKASRVPLGALVRDTFSQIRSDDVLGLAAEVAYYTVFALPPTIIFVVTAVGVFSHGTSLQVAGQLQAAINRGAPPDTRALIASAVRNGAGRATGRVAVATAVFSGAVAAWSGSNAMLTLMKAFNRAFDVEDHRSFVRKRLVAIGLMLLVMFLAGGAVVLFVAGRGLTSWLGDHALAATALGALQGPLALAGIMLLLAVLYHLGPDVGTTMRWASPGSIAATALWLLVVIGFHLYLRISHPEQLYGPLGTVIVLLLFLYLSGLAFLVGAEINAVLERRFDPRTRVDEVRSDGRHSAGAPDQPGA